MNKSRKFATLVLWVLSIISAILAISFIVNISENETDPNMLSCLGTNLVWAYILLGLALFIMIAFALLQMFTNFKAAKKGIASLVFIGVILLVSYLFASNEMPQFLGVQKFIDSGVLTLKVSKLVDMGLNATYIMLGIALISIIYSSVSRIFK